MAQTDGSGTARQHTDLSDDRWDGWIHDVCASLGVDPSLVDVAAIHDLTREVAHRYQRAMAPVSSYIVGIALGMALGADEGSRPDLAGLIARVEATLDDPS